jgi:hypothetical protein
MYLLLGENQGDAIHTACRCVNTLSWGVALSQGSALSQGVTLS